MTVIFLRNKRSVIEKGSRAFGYHQGYLSALVLCPNEVKAGPTVWILPDKRTILTNDSGDR